MQIHDVSLVNSDESPRRYVCVVCACLTVSVSINRLSVMYVNADMSKNSFVSSLDEDEKEPSGSVEESNEGDSVVESHDFTVILENMNGRPCLQSEYERCPTYNRAQLLQKGYDYGKVNKCSQNKDYDGTVSMYRTKNRFCGRATLVMVSIPILTFCLWLEMMHFGSVGASRIVKVAEQVDGYASDTRIYTPRLQTLVDIDQMAIVAGGPSKSGEVYDKLAKHEYTRVEAKQKSRRLHIKIGNR